MKINIEIELENGDYCNGCPYAIEKDDGMGCTYYKEYLDVINIPEIINGVSYGCDHYTRLDICKEQNKEIVK